MSTMRAGFCLTFSILKFHFKDRLLLKAQGGALIASPAANKRLLKISKEPINTDKNQSQNPSRTLKVSHSEGVYDL